jgi:hypothetical protein
VVAGLDGVVGYAVWVGCMNVPVGCNDRSMDDQSGDIRAIVSIF